MREEFSHGSRPVTLRPVRRAFPTVILVLCLLHAAAYAHAQDAATEPARARVLLVATRSHGVDPAVASVVDAALEREVAALGYQPSPQEQSRAVLAEVGAAEPPRMADVWRATYRSGALYALVAKVRAESGRYLVELEVACRDGRGPFHARATSGASDLAQVLAKLVAQALPPPSAASPQASADSLAGPAAPASGPPASTAPAVQAPAISVSTPIPAAPSFDRFRLAGHTEAAFGLSQDGFYNHLLGARVDYRLTPTLSLGGYLGYANLRGRGGRVGSLLYYAQLEQRVPIAPGSKLLIPLRLDLGYLIRNGSFLRIAPGLAIPLGERLEVVLDLCAPTFWLTPERSLFSLDFGVEVAGTF